MNKLISLTIFFLFLTNLKANPSADSSNIPNFKQIYDFQVGDIFLYKITTIDCSCLPSCCTNIDYEKYEIMQRINNDDSIIYIRKINDSSNDTIIYIDSVANILNKYNNKIVLGLIHPDTVFFRIRITSGPVPQKIIGGPNFTYQYNKGICDTTLLFNDPRLTQIYGLGLGLTYETDDGFEHGHETELVGYRKGGDTTGTLTTGILQLKKNDNILIYPNPFRDILSVKMNFSNGYQSYEIYTLQGILVKSIINNQNPVEISTAILKSGIYIFKISNSSGSIYRKIIKQE